MPAILRNLGKFNLIVLFAAVVTLVLFYGMQLLIMSDGTLPAPVNRIDIAAPTLPEIKFEIVKTTPKPAVPETPPELPERTTRVQEQGEPIRISPTPVLDTPVTIDDGFMSGLIDGNAMPVAQIQPQYPESAARRGQEGFVIVEFDVSEVGTVINPEILVSVPEAVFDRAALRALERWRYQPKVIDGRAVPMRGLQTRFTFSLEQ